jgi:hypothetical protein
MSSHKTVSPKFPKKIRNSVNFHGNIINKSLNQLLSPSGSAPLMLPKVGQNDYSQKFLIENAYKLQERTRNKHSGGKNKRTRRKQQKRRKLQSKKRCWL